MSNLNLNQSWLLREAPLHWGKEKLARVLREQSDWMECDLPCDVHMPLEAAGKIRDVVQSDYCFEAEWIEHRSWWFVKRFDGAGLNLNDEVAELTLEGLDAYADVFLNGEWLGTHLSAHYPFVKGVKKLLLPGENTLAVRVTTGLEQVSDAQLAELGLHSGAKTSDRPLGRNDDRRAFVRKPQYTVGWDWGPKALTCGIVKGVSIRTYDKTAIRGVHAATRAATEGGDARIAVSVEVEQLDIVSTRDATVEIRIEKDGVTCAKMTREDALLTSGLNFFDEELTIHGAQLWWPAGYGGQPLYTVHVAVICEGKREEYAPISFGIRTVTIDTSRMDKAADTRLFALIVNGVRVYLKGGDWIPSDSIYARVTDEKYRTLIHEARAANFNTLRIWGGGCYEYDIFYQLCDQLGILLWHDFMFACQIYPDHLDWFVREVEREFDYQTRRLRNHPSIALWSGNNENHWIYSGLFNERGDMSYEKQYGLKLANVYAKKAIRLNCPEIPFWNSSPYGGKDGNANNVGNKHHWVECMMNGDINKRIEPKEYDLVTARMVTEYGYPGPCPVESMNEYFDGQPIDRESTVWALHTNTFEKETVVAGIKKHYLNDVSNLSLDDYLLYAGMVQSTMLGYSLEAMRFKDYMSGSLFWMYNDTWGELGWTIIDYYLRRKTSFYGVKRAFAPIKLTLRQVEGKAVLQGINDTPDEISLSVRLGYMPFDGSPASLDTRAFTLQPRSRAYLCEVNLPDTDYTRGAFVAIPDAEAIEPVALRLHDVKALQLPSANVKIVKEEDRGEDLIVTLTAPGYIHGVHIDEPYAASDNYFDLLPGQVKTVTVEKGAGKRFEWHSVR